MRCLCRGGTTRPVLVSSLLTCGSFNTHTLSGAVAVLSCRSSQICFRVWAMFQSTELVFAGASAGGGSVVQQNCASANAAAVANAQRAGVSKSLATRLSHTSAAVHAGFAHCLQRSKGCTSLCLSSCSHHTSMFLSVFPHSSRSST